MLLIALAATLALIVAPKPETQTLQGKDLHLTYRSGVDGQEQPYRLYVPSSYTGERSVPLVVALHGTRGDQNTFFENAAYLDQPIARAAEKYRLLVVAPFGRGPMEYRGIAEHDVFSVVEDVKQRYRIDSDRIYLTGHSMGGTGAAYLVLHHPDVFAAVSPLSPAYSWPWLAENGRYVPFRWIAGARDQKFFLTGTSFGVERMRALGNPVDYIELEEEGHYGPVKYMESVVEWLQRHRLVRFPKEYTFVVDTPLHGQAYWTRVDRLLVPGRLARLNVKLTGNQILLQPSNVAEFSVFPEPEIMPLDEPLSVHIEGEEVFHRKLRKDQEIRLKYQSNRWTSAARPIMRRSLTDVWFTPIGRAPEQLDMGGVEATLANWIADAMRHATGADIAMINRQYYRGMPIPAGRVDMTHVLNAIGVNDHCLVVMELTGRDLLEILDDNVPDPSKDRHYAKDGPYADRLIQLSGARYVFDRRQPPGKHILSSDLVPERLYSVVFEGHTVHVETVLMAGRFGKIPYKQTDIPLSAALYGYAMRTGKITGRRERRVREVSSTFSAATGQGSERIGLHEQYVAP